MKNLSLKFNLNAYSAIRSVEIDKLKQNLNKLYNDIKFEFDSFDNIEDALKNFKKTVKPTPNYYILAQLNQEWSIIFDDQINSDGCSSLLYNLNRIFKYEGFKVNFNDLGISFTYYLDDNVRVINAYYDVDKWIFYQKGKALEFENPDYYRRKKIADRFNAAIFTEYLKRIGLVEVEKLIINSNKIILVKKLIK